MFNLTNTAKIVVPALALLATAVSFSSHASVTPDRTRLVFNESDKSISVTLRNNDPTLPYLAQSWIEDAKGNKISSPLAVLPPVQRIDAMMNGQVKVQGLPDINKLPADRESVFYFNVREIPPKSNKPNTLQIALQTRIKLFWRPKALENTSMKSPWQHKVTPVSYTHLDVYKRQNPNRAKSPRLSLKSLTVCAWISISLLPAKLKC